MGTPAIFNKSGCRNFAFAHSLSESLFLSVGFFFVLSFISSFPFFLSLSLSFFLSLSLLFFLLALFVRFLLSTLSLPFHVHANRFASFIAGGPLRVAVLHQSGTYLGDEHLADRIAAGGAGHVLVTTYAHLRLAQSSVMRHKWHYAVLDEGHRIRNPNARITLAAKQLQTENRIILSGSPIQNNLQELGRLLTLFSQVVWAICLRLKLSCMCPSRRQLVNATSF